MRRVLIWLRQQFDTPVEILALLGIVCIAVGFWVDNRPAALYVPGALMFYLALRLLPKQGGG